MADRFFIAPYDEDSGLQTNLKPWLIPDQAFSELNNAYVFRGRVRKRFGSRWTGDSQFSSRLGINLGTITGGAFSGNVRTINLDSGMPTAVGQSFSIGTVVFTVVNPASGPQQMLRTDNVVATATYDLSNSNVVISGVVAPNGTAVIFYTGFPVMGLLTYEQVSITNEYTIAFDTRYAYQYTGGVWNRISAQASSGAAVWTGDDSQFFWSTNWIATNSSTKIFFVTNFNENEPNFMRYYDGTSWNNFDPQIDAVPDFIFSAQILVLFKNRLLAMNTWEGAVAPGTNFNNRIAYSAYGSPLASNAWRRDIPGNGGAIDIPTTEAIITAEFVKDRLIVFCERSTWEVVFTGNQAFPFNVQQINTELGAESTFSIVPFDKICLGIGNVGIHACNGSNVERIDEKIPDEVFKIHNPDQGVERVYGIRDFYVEMVYWTFPDTDTSTNTPYPNRVLVFNYITGTWSFNDDSITAFGYFRPPVGVTWNSNTVLWDDESITWDSGSAQALFRQVIAGNQEGYVFICDADAPTNAPVIQITNITASLGFTVITAIEHNFRFGDYIYIQDAVWSDASNGLNGMIFQVLTITDENTFNIFDAPFTGTYIGGGLISRVSQISVTTKEYNFYAQQGRNAYISKVDFMVDNTVASQIQVDFYVSTSATPLLQDSAGNGVLLGTGTLDMFAYPTIPFEADASRLWHPVYFQADGEVVQLQLIMNDEQMRNTAIRESGFALHAMCIYAQPTSYRFQ